MLPRLRRSREGEDPSPRAPPADDETRARICFARAVSGWQSQPPMLRPGWRGGGASGIGNVDSLGIVQDGIRIREIDLAGVLGRHGRERVAFNRLRLGRLRRRLGSRGRPARLPARERPLQLFVGDHSPRVQTPPPPNNPPAPLGSRYVAAGIGMKWGPSPCPYKGKTRGAKLGFRSLVPHGHVLRAVDRRLALPTGDSTSKADPGPTLVVPGRGPRGGVLPFPRSGPREGPAGRGPPLPALRSPGGARGEGSSPSRAPVPGRGPRGGVLPFPRAP